jgi:hypothetical protein
MEIRHSWLDQVIEEALEPERAIVDPHHHFFEGTVFPDYHLEDLRGDIASGHRVEQTVFMECGMWYRKTGPEALAPVGETEAVAKIAAESAQGATGRVAAILGHADLRRGAAVREVLEAHVGTSELFRGIRHAAAWDADKTLMSSAKVSNLYADPAFREGFAQLAPLGLTLAAYPYHPLPPHQHHLRSPRDAGRGGRLRGPARRGPDAVAARRLGAGDLPQRGDEARRPVHALEWLRLRRARASAELGRARGDAARLLPARDRRLRP